MIFETEAYKFFPEDEDRQRQYVLNKKYTVLADSLEENNRLTPISGSVLKSILNQPPIDALFSEMIEAYRKGIVAGDILMSIYLMDKFMVTTEPSLKKAVYLLKDLYISKKFLNGKPYPRSTATITNSWNKFRLSAPIWAAIRLNMSYRYCTPGEEFSSEENLDLTLKVAADIFKFACKSVTKHGTTSKPLLDPNDCILSDYYLSNSLSLMATKARKPDVLINILKGYAAPI